MVEVTSDHEKSVPEQDRQSTFQHPPMQAAPRSTYSHPPGWLFGIPIDGSSYGVGLEKVDDGGRVEVDRVREVDGLASLHNPSVFLQVPLKQVHGPDIGAVRNALALVVDSICTKNADILAR